MPEIGQRPNANCLLKPIFKGGMPYKQYLDRY